MAKPKKKTRRKPKVEDGIYWEQWVGGRCVMRGHYDGEPPGDANATRDTRAYLVAVPVSTFRKLNGI